MQTTDSRIYVGRLVGGRPAVYAVGAATVERLLPAAGELRWGAGVDATALACVLIADATGSEPPPEACERFAHQVLRRLPQDGFALQRETVDAWMRRFVTV